jgi:tRNA threonylcarbamoyladenosine biosynthesis protein TsaB
MLLAIDTCGTLGGVALGAAPPVAEGNAGSPEKSTSQSRDVAHPELFYRELAGKTFSERLISTISEMVADAGVQLSQLVGIVIVHGPGSFTGVRIGVSAAKALAEALSLPVIAVSRLELLARQALDANAVAVLDAGRGEFFVGIYRGGHGRRVICEMETLATRGELLRLIADSALPVLVCEDRVWEALAEAAPVMVAAPTVAEALGVGVERFRVGSFDDVATLDANYLRRSETEMLERIAQHKALRASRAGTPSPS